MTSRPLAQLQHTAVLRTAWLIAAVGTMVVMLMAVPLRYQMLLDDVYGYGTPLAEMGISLRFFAVYFVFWELLLAGGAWMVGVIIAWRKGDDWFALLSALTLMLIGFMPPLMDGLMLANAAWTWPIVFLRTLCFTGLMVVFCLFPNGRFVPGWLRFVLIGWMVNVVIVLLFFPEGLADTAIMPNTNTLSDALWLVYRVVWFVPVMAAQWYRYRRVSTAVEQQQTKWVVWGFTVPVLISLFNAILLAGIPVLRTDPVLNTVATLTLGVLLLLSTLLIPLTLAFAIFRYRLWQIDFILNRTLVYGSLTGLVTAVYILLVGGVGSLAAGEQSDLAALLVATVIAVWGIRPLHRRIQAQVNKWLPPPPTNRAKTKNRLTGIVWLRVGWGFFVFLALVLFVAGLVSQAQNGFWQPPSAEVLASAPLLANPFGAEFFLANDLYPFALAGGYIQAAIFVCVGLFLFWRKSGDVMGVLASWMLIAIGLGFTPTIVFLPVLEPAWHLTTALFQAGLFGSAFLFLCLFPNGRFYPHWSRPIAAVWLGYVLLWLPWPQLNLHRASTIWPAVVFAGAVWVGIVAQLLRYRRVSSPDEKQQTKWVIAGFAAANFGLLGIAVLLSLETVLPVALLTGAVLTLALMPTFIPISIAVALLRYRLWQVDVILNRTLVYGGLTGLITAVYILLVGGIGALAANQSGQIIGLVLATVIVMVGIRPFYQRWQTAVNRYVPIPQQLPAPQENNNQPTEIQPPSLADNPPHVTVVRPWFAPLALLLFSLVLSSAIGFILLNFSVCRAYSPLNVYWLEGIVGPAGGLAFAIVGLVISYTRPANRIGWLCLSGGLGLGLGSDLDIYMNCALAGQIALPGAALMAWFNYTILPLLTILSIFIFLPLWFPNGRFLTSRWRTFTLVLLALMSIATLAIAVTPDFRPYNSVGASYPLDNPLGLTWLPSWWGTFFGSTLNLLMISGSLAAIVSMILRLKRARGDERQQMKWFAYFLGTAVTIQLVVFELILFRLAPHFVDTVWYDPILFAYNLILIIVFLGFPLIIGMTIFKYRLYDIDIIINRTLVYGGLSLGIAAVYALTVGGLSLLFQAQNNLLISLLATGLIAILFQPVRERLQRTVNKMTFGDRDDPAAVLARLGQRLEAISQPDAVLPAIVETVAQALKLPYVAIAVEEAEGSVMAAVGVHFDAPLRSFPLVYQGGAVGQLQVAPRSPGEALSEADERVLQQVALQAGTAVHAIRLTHDLQQSRIRLVTTREEERRRLRRDLHDELGPTLASQTFTLDAALDLLETDPQAAAKLLQSLKAQNQETVADIRRLVYELRPPTLDELGVVGALQAHVAQVNGRDTLKIRIIADPDPLSSLPAAVEVAAYRIVLEAMNNVMRHAQAQRCDVRLRVKGNGRSYLCIEVSDDGIGLPAEARPGVGLSSMRERAEELGGRHEVAAGEDGGTKVTAVLPLMIPKEIL